MPEAARITDLHACPRVEPSGAPHVGGPIFAGSGDVVIGYLPAARVGDAMVCFPVGPTDSIKAGAATVLINSRGAARRSDPGSHIGGDLIVQGCPTVLIGDTPQAAVLRAAARRGTPFCEECERKRREREAKEIGEGETIAPDDDVPPPPPAPTLTLADPEPPPGVRDPLTGLTASRAALAREVGGDELDGVRKAARYAEAYRFYFEHGEVPVKPARIWSHIGGVAIDRPVEVVDVAGRTLYQRGFPGGPRNGEYFAEDPDTTPEQLGTSSVVAIDRDGERTLVERDRRTITYNDTPTPGLRSTAAPIGDFWSLPTTADHAGRVVACAGGGVQIMIPRALHGASATTVA